tara:strand:+ start:70 stop:633 length:564 start_codon:yes stop_codon:yes gene_type:complete
MKIILLILCSLTINFTVNAANILSHPPKEPKINEHYVFYSHGLIVEGKNLTPKHDRFGLYDFPAVKNALAYPKYNLIAYHRPLKTDPFKYANSLSEQVTTLIDKGVPPKNITLVGFSRGGFITALASSILANKELNYVIMTACTSRLAKNKDVEIHGSLLSIYETSDGVGSCNNVVNRNLEAIVSYQ